MDLIITMLKAMVMSKLKSNFLYNIIYQLLKIILPLITAPYVSRVLGAEGVGTYSYIYSIANYFVIFAMLGISNYGNRGVAIRSDDRESLSVFFSEVFLFQLINSLLVLAVYVAYVFMFMPYGQRFYAVVAMLYVISAVFDISWLYFGIENFKITVTRNVIIKIITTILIFIFVKERNHVANYLIILCGGIFVSQIYLWLYIKKYVDFKLPKISSVKKHIKPILVLFIPVIAYSIYNIMDKIMLGSMADMTNVGFYENGYKIMTIPMGIITALGTVMLPRMANLAAKNDENTSRHYIIVSIKLVTFIGVAISFGIAGVSKCLAPIYFGEEFRNSYTTMAILSVTVIFLSWANVVRTQYLIPRQEDKIYVISTFTGAFINLGINYMFIPRLGAIGAALGTVCAEASVFVAQIFLIRKKWNVISDIINELPYIFFGIIMAAVVYMMGVVFGEGWILLGFQVLVGGLVYITLVLIWLYYRKDEMYYMITKSIYSILKKVGIVNK